MCNPVPCSEENLTGACRVLTGVALSVAFLVVAPAAPAALEPCPSSRSFGGFPGGKTGSQVLIDASGFQNNDNEMAQFWETHIPSNGTGVGNAGTCPSQAGNAWWQDSDQNGTLAPGMRAIRGFASDLGCTLPACPDVGSGLTFLIEDATADGTGAGFILYAVDETPAGERWYDLARTDPNAGPGTSLTHIMESLPAIVLTGALGSPPNMTLAADYADIDIAFHGVVGPTNTPLPGSAVIDSYDVMWFHGAADPGRLRSAWSQLHSIPYMDGRIIGDTINVPCPDDLSRTYLAIGITFDGVPSRLVGSSIWLPCGLCAQTDDDLDGYSECAGDCDNTANAVFPGAPQICDGLNNNCNDPAWPALNGNEFDNDGDDFTECNGDCDDDTGVVYPNAPAICDGLNNDCTDPTWPALDGTNEVDDDGDTFSECAGDCDDDRAEVFPAAAQLCDGLNNDCDDPLWPAVPADEIDADEDTFSECEGDCNDEDDALNPAASEICNGIDDDCNTLVDEDAAGEDPDGDGIHSLCDNCPQFFNISQADTDGDDVGNVCDNCALDFNPNQDDLDVDAVGDACDNCVFDKNPTQTDVDDDFEGDHCDLDDGIIYCQFTDPVTLDWQDEAGFGLWNEYRGDLQVLALTGVYTQVPGSNPLAALQCGLAASSADESTPPVSNATAYYLVTGIAGNTEGSLGVDSEGLERPNTNPCP